MNKIKVYIFPLEHFGKESLPLGPPQSWSSAKLSGSWPFFQIFGYWIMYFMFKIAEKSNPCIVRQIMRAFCPKPCLPNSQILERHVYVYAVN